MTREAGDTIKVDSNAGEMPRGPLPDPFGAPAGLKVRGDDGRFESPRTVEEMEGFEGSPEPEDDIEVTEGEEEEVEAEEPDAEAVDEEDVEAEETLETADEEEVPADATPRAQKRIRALANERNTLNIALEQMRAQHTLLQQQVQRQNALAEAEEARRQEATTKMQSETKLRQFQEHAQLMGFQANDPYLQLYYDQAQEMQKLQARFEAQDKQREQADRQQRNDRYVAVLNDQLSAALKPYAVDDSVRQGVFQNALALAAAHQIADPAQAVQLALRPIAKALPKAVKTAAKKSVPTKAAQAQRLVATRGASGGRVKGQTNGKQQRRTVEELEKEMGSKGEW